jgi:gamma-glutamylcyclotransferase
VPDSNIIPYFAYGANMSADHFARRLGRAFPQSFRRRRAVLHGYKLVFNKRARSDAKAGFANIVPSSGADVEGILNHVTEAEISRLDLIESAPAHYVRSKLPLIDDSGTPLAAHIYIANPDWVREGLLPRRAYMHLMLQGGDLLSEQYVAWLRAVACND